MKADETLRFQSPSSGFRNYQALTGVSDIPHLHLGFNRRVRVSEITKRWRVSDIPHLHLGFNRRVRVSEMSKRWRVSDILHSFHKGFSDSYCEICQQILLCFLKGDQSSVISNDRADAYLRRAGAHGEHVLTCCNNHEDSLLIVCPTI